MILWDNVFFRKKHIGYFFENILGACGSHTNAPSLRPLTGIFFWKSVVAVRRCISYTPFSVPLRGYFFENFWGRKQQRWSRGFSVPLRGYFFEKDENDSNDLHIIFFRPLTGIFFWKKWKTETSHTTLTFSVPLRGYFFEKSPNATESIKTAFFSVPLRGYFFEKPRRMSPWYTWRKINVCGADCILLLLHRTNVPKATLSIDALCAVWTLYIV